MRTSTAFILAVGFILLLAGRTAGAQKYELKMPDNVSVQRFDFEQKGIEGWKTVDGKWTVEEMPGRLIELASIPWTASLGR